MKLLFDLCQGMSMNEKRYFKTFSHSAISTQLFDAINSNPADPTINQRFSAREKNYLYESVLKSLRSYHSDRSINRLIDNYTHDIDILLAKEMYDQALGRLKKAKKIAVKYDKHIQMLNLLRLERRLAIYMGDGKDADIQKVNEKIIDELKSVRYQMEVEIIISQHREGDLKDRNSPFRKHAEKVVNKAKEELPSSFQDSYLFLRIMAFLLTEVGDDESSLKYFDRIKEKFESDYKKLSTSTLDAYAEVNYQALLHHRLNVIKRIYQPNTYFQELEKLIPEKGSSRRESSRIFVNLLISLTDYCIIINRPNEGLGFYDKYRDRIDNLVYDMDRVEMLYFNIIYLYFIMKDLKQANRLLIKYLNLSKIRYKYIFKCMQFVNIIIKYEMGNKDYAYQLLKRIVNKLKREGNFSAFDEYLFEMLEAIIANKAFHLKEIALGNFIKTTKAMREGTVGNNRDNLNQFFNFYSWFRHKLYKEKFVPNPTMY